MSGTSDELLALDVLGLRDDPAELDARELGSARAELEHAASLLAVSVAPISPPPALRERLLATLRGPERLAPFVDRTAALIDVAAARVREIFALFDEPDRWTTLFPGASFYELDGGPALGEATAGLVRIAAGLWFPHHRHIGEERVFVLQGAFIDDSGAQVGPGQLAVMPDGSAHAFRVVSADELLYVVVVGEVEFDDGSRAP